MKTNLQYKIFFKVWFCLFFSVVLIFANAQPNENEEPLWVKFQKAMNFYSEKNYGEAFRYLRDITGKKDYPEAEYWIGKIFENEGENTLALRQYERAIDLAHKAETSEFYIEVTLSIADIYEKEGKYNLYEQILERLITDIKRNSKVNMEYETTLTDRILSVGLDKLLYYFRHEGDSLLIPYGRLGEYYFKNSRDRNSVKYLSAAVTIIFTELVEMHRNYDPLFTYSDCRSLFLNSEKDAAQKEYMVETDFYRKLFFLALALDNLGELNQSKYIFGFLAESSVKNNYTDMAARIKKSDYSTAYKNGIKKALLFSFE